jgi:hypothetical protein
MNAREINLLEAATEHLRARGFAAAIEHLPRDERGRQIDAVLRLRKDKQEMKYAVEVKRQVTPATLGAVVAQLKHLGQTKNQPFLVVTNHITPPMADQLVAMDQQFLDAAGNGYLNAPGIFVLVTGRRPENKTAPDRPGRAFTTAGLKTLFAFLRNPELAAAPYREIAEAAGVALGALPAVLAGLQQAGHLQVMGNKRKLVATKRLLDDWALAYARTLRPKQLLRTFVATTFENWREWDLKADHAQWGGEPAAALLTKYLRPGILTLYAEKAPAHLIVEQRLTTARANDEQGLVEIRKPFWGDALQEGDTPVTVAPALVYADLLATGNGRCIETAQLLYETDLAGLFPETRT